MDYSDSGTDNGGTGDTGSSNGEDGGRKRRSASGVKSAEKSNKTKATLRKTNSASSVLGLNVLLNGDEDNYQKGLIQNNYDGFTVNII